MTILFVTLGLVLGLCLSWARLRFLGFAAQKPDDYHAATETFDLRRHLNGALSCDGVIYGPTGRVASRFTAAFHVTWTGAEGVMTERFQYESGAVQDREWSLHLDPSGKITAHAADLVGAGQGKQCGDAVQLRYRIRLEPDAGGHVLDVVDWMYLAPGGTIVNRSQFRKFGILVGELVATMRPVTEVREVAAE
ncbi:MAG: DUF3833 domain-containing protein [Pelagimonas sp.]|jgi:hypothetical protein|nr:DUF3833 domain-containing protein [Pelagimonas sp.]